MKASEYINAIKGMKPHQWVMIGGFAMSFVCLLSGVAGMEVDPELSRTGFWAGIVLVVAGAGMSMFKPKQPARRQPTTPTSNQLDFLGHFDQPLSATQVREIPRVKGQSVAELVATVNILRARLLVESELLVRSGDMYSRPDQTIIVGARR